jgi:prepilin-type processing-associated H-X9-DG protein
VYVDRTTPGLYTSNSQKSPGTIPAGTRVDVYYVHYDPVRNENHTVYDGAMYFSQPILGIVCFSGSLDRTDSTLGNPNTQYPTGQGARGYENGAEQIELTDDMKGFLMHRFHSTFPGENTRIVTAPGGAPADYGMNSQVVASQRMRSRQVLMTDYDKSVINVGLEGGADYQWNDHLQNYSNRYVDLRHFGKANVLYCDGHVVTRADNDFFDPRKEHWPARKN